MLAWNLGLGASGGWAAQFYFVSILTIGKKALSQLKTGGFQGRKLGGRIKEPNLWKGFLVSFFDFWTGAGKQFQAKPL